MIKDSGERHEFGTGAVRDMQHGKGRFDLVPLDVLASKKLLSKTEVLNRLADFQNSGITDTLYMALIEFCEERGWPVSTMLMEVSVHFENGALKYGEYNWQRGIPTHSYLSSAVRHYLKWRRGDDDEPHDRAFCWNAICCIWTIKHKPELHDIPFIPKKNEEAISNE